jgi:hypothetical protein
MATDMHHGGRLRWEISRHPLALAQCLSSEVTMITTRSEPFPVTRIPGLNGEWIDAHIGLDGRLNISASGYVSIDGEQLIAALEVLVRD